MKKAVKKFRIIFCLIMALSMCLAGCGKDVKEEVIPSAETTVSTSTEIIASVDTQVSTDTDKQEEKVEEKEDEILPPPEGDYIELALNVYYNDSKTKYYNNEAGPSIYVTEEGQYTVKFNCERHLSEAAKNSGVKYLKNLTAVYILDMGVAKGNQSPLVSCDIMYDSVKVNGTELTITQTSPKKAFKSNGVFDTNDPINGWDGSLVSEVEADSNHAANFTTVTKPAEIEVTFTLSNMVWGKMETEEKTEEKTEIKTEPNGVNKAVFSNLDFTKMNALTLTKYMGNGINLGNTMEAYGHTVLGTKASVKSYETFWGQPETTAEMMVGMKNSGFDSIRIPVAWTNMMDYENGDYTINKAYMDRVEQIVKYALDAEMFVVLNDHWDGGWWAMFGSKTPETVEKAWTIYESIWTQIAERFKDYSHMLIFESANEELGNSLNNNGSWPDSGKLTITGCYEMTNKINQRFVDLIRSTGGNNADRFLLVAGYNTDIDMTVDSRYVMPTDSAKEKLILSVHYYSPWNYCGSEKQARWGLKTDYSYMNRQFAKLQKFTKEGYGIIIGEYAALPIYNSADGSVELKENTIEFTENLLDNCDLYNYVPMLWSCNDFFNKKTCTMINDKITDLFVSRRMEVENIDEASLKASMDAKANSAVEIWGGVKVVPAGAPVAWIMWNGGAGTYSVGDTYNPADNTNGIIAHDVVLNGAGEYTVSLDFEGGNDGVTFAALAVANGESLFSKPTLDIKEITIDGKKLELTAVPYTSSDNGITTRVNLYNTWVSGVPHDARVASGADANNASAVIFDKTELVGIKNITITFELVMNK